MMLGPKRCLLTCRRHGSCFVEERVDQVKPIPIGTSFRHCILNVLRVSRSWNLLFCRHIHSYRSAATSVVRILFIGHTAEFSSSFPDRTHQDIKALMECPSATQARIFATSISVHTLHVNMSAVLLQSPRRAELLPMRSSAAAAGQFLAWRAVDGQTEEVARLTEVGVPVAVRNEVDES